MPSSAVKLEFGAIKQSSQSGLKGLERRKAVLGASLGPLSSLVGTFLQLVLNDRPMQLLHYTFVTIEITARRRRRRVSTVTSRERQEELKAKEGAHRRLARTGASCRPSAAAVQTWTTCPRSARELGEGERLRARRQRVEEERNARSRT